MPGVVHISEMISLALHSMAYIANNEQDIVNVKEISAATGCSEAHLVKVLQRLVRAGFLYSMRGPRGGFGLAKKPDQVTLLDIYQVIDGTLILGKCPTNHSKCPFKTCIFGGLPEKLDKEFIKYLSSTKLSDFSINDLN